MRQLESHTRHFVVWGDHSSLLNNGFMLYTTKVLYSKDVFYTDDENFKATGKRVNVQSVVEQPWIYIFANCRDNIAEKMSFVSVRREDVMEMASPLTIGNVILNDKMIFFKVYFLIDPCFQYTVVIMVFLLFIP